MAAVHHLVALQVRIDEDQDATALELDHVTVLRAPPCRHCSGFLR
jgi:hypothetical protein